MRGSARACALIMLLGAGPANADSIRYSYDARGRLVQTFHQAGPASGVRTQYTFDDANNRTRVETRNVTLLLNNGQNLYSPDGRFRLAMQSDGNLVLYYGTSVLWASMTFGSGHFMSFQADGNLVIYNASAAVWSTGTDGHPGAELKLQNDGNLVIYLATGPMLWNTVTCCH